MTASQTDPLQHALDLAYRYLNRRERTRTEVGRRLEQAGIEQAVREEALSTLTEQGVLDDTRFVRLFVEDKRGLEGWGNERIRPALLRRGIDRDLVDDALHGADGGERELDRGLELLRVRFPIPPQDRRERDRALGIMLRKGYEPDVALDALAAYARELPTE
ncbi:MAG: regulatory protein RecX [Solirubrobacterales bacterium]|nr:regulatory protein RecX [Solirubrobacterales bacterium]